MTSRQVSRLPCEKTLGQKCCPACRIFSWMGLSHRNLSRRILGSSLPRESSLVALSPFLKGMHECDAGRRRLTIDMCLCSPSSVPSFHVPHAIFLPLVLLLRDISYANWLTLPVNDLLV